MKILLLFLFIILFHFSAYSQVEKTEGVYELRRKTEKTKVALVDILGDWYSTDSTSSKISFIQRGDGEVYIEGKKDAVNYYSFNLEGDSVFVNGLAANWPPFYCTLYLHADQVLEIRYYQLNDRESNNVIYRRQEGE
jgi:hypothetical protein